VRGGPLAKLRAARGTNAIANRLDQVQVVEFCHTRKELEERFEPFWIVFDASTNAVALKRSVDSIVSRSKIVSGRETPPIAAQLVG
jgi:hypothetical protein